ncbi:hypothetical protein F5H01DRAFT_322640 [Linnemannia elongata]|nr:hypothetical protein F5H01DRAFT_322640 [Linnemannia elongata]
MTSAETRESARQKTDWIRSLEMDLQDTLFEDLPPPACSKLNTKTSTVPVSGTIPTSATHFVVPSPCLQCITLDNINHANEYVHQPLLIAMMGLEFPEEVEMRTEIVYNHAEVEAIFRRCSDSLVTLTVKSKSLHLQRGRDVGSGDDADTDYELDADDSTDTEAYTAADVEPTAVIISAAGAGTLRISVLEPVLISPSLVGELCPTSSGSLWRWTIEANPRNRFFPLFFFNI